MIKSFTRRGNGGAGKSRTAPPLPKDSEAIPQFTLRIPLTDRRILDLMLRVSKRIKRDVTPPMGMRLIAQLAAVSEKQVGICCHRLNAGGFIEDLGSDPRHPKPKMRGKRWRILPKAACLKTSDDEIGEFIAGLN